LPGAPRVPGTHDGLTAMGNLAHANRETAMTEPNRNPAPDVGYARYIADPAMRGRIDREVRRLRREAIDRYVLDPLAAWVRRIAGMARADRPATAH